MTPTREHIAGLELAHKIIEPYSQWCAEALLRVIAQAKAAPVQGEAVADDVFSAEFAAWWESDGQYCRSGGGDYERTFASEAWRHFYPRIMAEAKPYAEPVAWQMFDGEGGYLYTDDEETADSWRKYIGDKYTGWLKTLYTAPPSPDAELVELLAEARKSLVYKPSCQDGAVVHCSCEACVLYRIDAKLAELRK